MTFFVTSAGPGKGGDLGGLEGADRHCQALASAAGAGKPHLARLPEHAGREPDRSRRGQTRATASAPARGHNAKGALIARNVDELHSAGQQPEQGNRR